MKKGILIAVILVVVGLAIAAGAYFAGRKSFSLFDTAKYVTNTYDVADAFTRIEIETGETDVILKRAQDAEARVECVERENVKHTVAVENGTLKIGVGDQRNLTDWLSFSAKPMSVTVYLPAEQYDALNVVNSTGDITVAEPFTFRSMNLRASTGDIRLDGTKAGEMALHVSTGDISVDNAAVSGALTVSVSTGKTNMVNVTCASFTSEGSTGRVTLTDVVASGRMYVKRSTGKIRLENCDAGEIELHATTGDISGTLRSEKVFSAKASTGRINVPTGTNGGRCEITTSTGNIDFSISGK